MANRYGITAGWLGALVCALLLAAPAHTVVMPTTVPDVTGMSVEDATQEIGNAGLMLVAVTTQEIANESEWNTVISQTPQSGIEVDHGAPVYLDVGIEPGPWTFAIDQPANGANLMTTDTVVVTASKPIPWNDNDGIFISWDILNLQFWRLGGDPYCVSCVYWIEEVSADSRTVTFGYTGLSSGQVYSVRATSFRSSQLGPYAYFHTGTTIPSGRVHGSSAIPIWAQQLNIDRGGSFAYLKPPYSPMTVEKPSDLMEPDGFRASPAFGIAEYSGDPSTGNLLYDIRPVLHGDYHVKGVARFYENSPDYGRYAFGVWDIDNSGDPDVLDVLGETTANLPLLTNPLGLSQGDVYLRHGVSETFRFDLGRAPENPSDADFVLVESGDHDFDLVAGRSGIEFASLGYSYSTYDFRSPIPGTPLQNPGDMTWSASAAVAADGYLWHTTLLVRLPDDTYGMIEFSYPDAYGGMSKIGREAVQLPQDFMYYVRWAWQPSGELDFGPGVAGWVEMPNLIGLTEEEAIALLMRYGFEYYTIEYEVNPDQSTHNKVAWQDVAAGTEVYNRDTSIQLIVFAPHTPVEIVNADPAPGQTDVSTERTVSITFSDPVPVDSMGDPELEIWMFPDPLHIGPTYLMEGSDGKTIATDVTLDEDQTYQVFVVLDEQMPISYVFSTGSTLATGLVAGQLRIETSAFVFEEEMPVKPSKAGQENPLMETGFAVFLATEFPSTLAFNDCDTPIVTRITATRTGDFVLTNVPAGEYYVLATSTENYEIPDYGLTPDLIGFLDANNDGVPDKITVAPAGSVTGLEVNINRAVGWPRIAWASPGMFETDVPHSESVTISLRFSDDFEPYHSAFGIVQMLPVPESGALDVYDFEVWQDEDYRWRADADVTLAPETTYSLWIMEMSKVGGTRVPIRHVFTTGSAIPGGRIDGVVSVPPLMQGLGDMGAFAMASSVADVPDITGGAPGELFGFESIIGFGMISPNGQYRLSYLPDGAYYPTGMVIRDFDEELMLATVVDYGQYDANSDGVPDAVTISPVNRRANANITLSDRQSRLRVTSVSPAQGAVSVSQSTVLRYTFSKPVWDGEDLMLELNVLPHPLSHTLSKGESDYEVALEVGLAPNTIYNVFFPIAETGVAFDHTFTTGSSLPTGSISGNVFISPTIPKPYVTFVALLNEPVVGSNPEEWSVRRIKQTISGDYRFDYVGPGTHYVVAFGYGEDGMIMSSGGTEPRTITEGQALSGANVGFGAGSLEQPPVVEMFDAFIVKATVGEPPFQQPYYVPVVRARITDPNGNETIDEVVLTQPDGSEMYLPVELDGNYEVILDARTSWAGGEFSITASDITGRQAAPKYDYVPEVTLQAPAIVSPLHGTGDVSPTVRLDWTSVTNAQGYLLHVSTESPINIMDPPAGLEAFLSPENAAISFTEEFINNSEYPVPPGALEPDTQYWWVVGAADSRTDIDQLVISQPASFTTAADGVAVDTQPPVFQSNPTAIGWTDKTVTIRWTTDEPADSRVLYGTQPGAYTDSVVSTIRTYEHLMTVPGLSANTQYYFAVASTDRSGNRAFRALSQPVKTDVVPDTKPPVFTRVPVMEGIGQDRVTVMWENDKPTTAVVHLFASMEPDSMIGMEPDSMLGYMGDIVVNIGTANRNHRVVVTGLDPSTQYAVMVHATDLSGNSYPSAVRSFFTRIAPDTTPPVALSGPVAIPSEADALVSWIADEPHTATVLIRTMPGRESVGEYYQPALARIQSVRVSGLSADTRYEALVTMKDASDNQAKARPIAFRTLAVPDTKPPQLIKPPSISYRSDTRVVVTWETDKPSDSYLRVFQGGVPVRIVSSGELVRRHRLVVTNLTPGQSYMLQIKSTDAAGNTRSFPRDEDMTGGAARLAKVASRTGTSFSTSSTPDETWPVITSSPVVTSQTASTFSVQWQTDKTANSVLYFGEAGSGKLSRATADQFTQSVTETDYVTTHTVTVTGLNKGSQYEWMSGSTDPSGNGETQSSIGLATTLQDEDTSPPQIHSGPAIIGQTDSRLTVRWYTDKPSNSTVRWGKAGTGDLQSVMVDPDLVTEHVVTLTNLDPSTQYVLEVQSTDLIGNTSVAASTAGETAGEPDTTPPSLNALNVIVDAEQTLVRWKTDEPADTWLDYGTSPGYGTVVTRSQFTTEHSLVLTNLTPSTEYFYQIASSDAAGNIANLTGLTFTTLDEPNTTPPAPVPSVSAEVGAYAVRLAWPASEDSTVLAGYLVERASGGGYSQIAGPLTNRVYTDNTVSLNTQYSYRIRAKDVSAAGNVSDPSVSVDVTPTVNDAPNAPVAVQYDVTGLLPTLMVENATANSRPITSYAFLLSANESMTQVVATGTGITPGADTTRWEVPFPLTHDTDYWFAARAVDDAGFPGPLSSASKFRADKHSTINIVLASFAATNHRRMVRLEWELAEGEALGFHVERGIAGSFTRMTESPLTSGPQYDWIDASVVPGREYEYRLVALLPNGSTRTFEPISVTAALPTQVSLSQNVPNPFNPSTAIRYEVPYSSQVRLVIYNALGQEVRVLVNRVQETGWHQATWDGRTATGLPASSGIYIARLVVSPEGDHGVSAESRVIKMLMLR